jgi:FAD:protein FMN transferase
MMTASVLSITAVAALAGLTGCAATSRPVVLQGEGLGSTWSVKLAAAPPVESGVVRRGIQARVDEVARHLSRWDSSSRISEINAASSDDWQSVPPVLFEPLSYALRLAADTGGAFDPTVAPLVDVWGFGTAGRRYEPPTADAIRAARGRTGYSRIALDSEARRVRKPAGMQLDLSSMTHGFAADRVAGYLNDLGVSSYLVDVGSEIRARGESPEGGAWRVAVERPPDESAPYERQNGSDSNSAAGSRSRTASDAGTSHARDPDAPPGLMHVVRLRDAGIATSGNYRYYFDYNGRRYSHRIDPRTGAPVTHDLASVTVIDPLCLHADALATALTVLGPDEGMKYATDRNIAALFILRIGEQLVEKMTPRFATYLN